MSVNVQSHVTLHLAPLEVWESQARSDTYLPEAYAADGFIHCTDGEERVIQVANQFYSADPRPFVVLSVNLGANGQPWKYEDPEEVFPHIYGPINPMAVTRIRHLQRDKSGAFTGIA